MKRILLISLLIVSACFIQQSYALDYPHDGLNCSSVVGGCHAMHSSPGTSLLTEDTIANTCKKCHGDGDTIPFRDGDRADPDAGTGNQHAWETSMDPGTAPLYLVAGAGGKNNKYGLRVWTELENAQIMSMMNQQGGKVTCVACHQTHDHQNSPWDPDSADGSATAELDARTIIDDTKTWTNDEWIDAKVTMMNPLKFGFNRSGRTRKIIDNDETTLMLESDLTATVTTGDEYYIHSGRHFQRVPTDLNADPNNINDMCEDCHYYRSPAATGGSMDVTSWDGDRKSHIIIKNLTTDVKDATQFVGAAPLETNDNPQTTAPRYHEDGTGDTNPTNNMVLDSSSKVRCLSCHGVHFTDSDESTIDAPQ